MLSFLVFIFIYLLINNFSKRLIPLLSLEGLMLLIIWSIYSFGSSFTQCSFFSYGILFLIMMVLDSVLGICMLVNSCRSSTIWNLNF